MITETIKGFRDITSEQAKKREKIRSILKKRFELYGFEPAETPIIESEDFVKGDNSKDEAVSDIFKLEDKGKRKLALRYELTFQLKRLAINKKLPYKVYRIGEVFRDEPTTSNRFRQFTQCDIDTIGATIKDEAEILALASEALLELGISPEICINSRKLLNEILEKEGIKEKDRVIIEIDKLDKLPESQIKENLKKYKAEKILDIFKKQQSYFKKYEAYKEVEELIKYCNLYNTKVEFRPFLARGLSYYNGNVFEIKTRGVKETIFGGGTYPTNGINSTGASFGLDRIEQLAKPAMANQKVLIISIGKDKEAINFAQLLRKNNIPAVFLSGKPSKALEYANSQGIDKIIFIGEDEAKKGKFKLRDMKTGKEEMLKEKEVIEKLSD